MDAPGSAERFSSISSCLNALNWNMWADGGRHRPIMIHRVVFGSIERFIGILTEHFAGAFPMRLAPVQVKVLPISEHQMDRAKEISEQLTAAGLRAELDSRSEKIGYKIREAQLQKGALYAGDRRPGGRGRHGFVRRRKGGMPAA